MSQNKNIATAAQESIQQFAGQLGLTLMAAATVTGMLELPNHANSRIILPGQPSFAAVTDNEEANNPIRREKEEAAPHYMSYAITQRTPSRASKK